MNRPNSRQANIGVVVITLFICIPSTNLFAQHYREISLSNGEHLRMESPNQGTSSVAIVNGKIVSAQKENPDEEVRLIVTFKDQPLTAYEAKKSSLQKASLLSIYASLQASHVSFKTALTTISQQLSNKFKSDYRYTITRDYYRALNGVAMKCKRNMIGSIRALPIVKQVSEDREVKANLEESVHQIRADIVRDSLGYTGKGVLVGDVDTGIDYYNPALGGGFGPAFRVIGGYDFANNDNDPMDDHGHGTHVAGIIGANGGDTLRGVAPEAKFLAVKVLDAKGSGWMSDVIAGIDYCLDPDGNPATNDAVNIINMSLGGEPSNDSPVDSAVNNATKAGVLCVVAAGNSGLSGYGTIGSPGTSETALTVGACDSVDQIAYFSSLGPDPIHYFIKPEVVAPGVRILSTILHNQTASWSGTSMAAPHVTGIAALLKQEHPLWTPEEIKAAIINTAHSVEDSVSIFAQGKGRVDALDAAKARMVVEPGVMSFGYTDLAKNVWRDTVQLTVKNFRSVTQNTQISIVNGPPSGATLTFDKTSFSLAPGEETTILAVLTVLSSVPVIPTEPFAYLGKIKVVSDSDNVIVPFSFIKSTTLVITFDRPPQPVPLFLIDRTSGYFDQVRLSEGATKVVVPITESQSLEILAIMNESDTLGFLNGYVVDHKIGKSTGLTYVNVSHNEAGLNTANDTIYNIFNNRVTPDFDEFAEISYKLFYFSDYWSVSINVSYQFSPSRSHVFISTLDSSFYVSKRRIVPSGSEYYILDTSMDGIRNQQDLAIATGADNLFSYHATASYEDPPVMNPSNWAKYFIIGSNTITLDPGGWSADFTGIYFNTLKGDIFFNRQGNKPEPKNGISLYSSNYFGVGVRNFSPDSTTMGLPELRTPNFIVNGIGEARFEEAQATFPPALTPTIIPVFTYETKKPGDTIKVEQFAQANLPDYITFLYRGKLYMSCNTSVDLDPFLSTFGFINTGIIQFNGIQDHITNFDPNYYIPSFTAKVYANNRAQTNAEPLKAGTQQDAYYRFDNLSDDIATVQVMSEAHPYTLLGQAGQCSADFEYQLKSSSSVFPSFKLLQVAVDGRAVDKVRPDQNGIIRLNLYDSDSSVNFVGISLVPASGVEIELPVTFIGGREYSAAIPADVPTGFTDVVARIKDTKGNKCELTASPGFFYGSTLNSARRNARLRMNSYSLDNVESVNMQAGDTLKYTLSYTNFGSDTARNVVVTFPTTSYFRPVDSPSWTKSSFAVTDTVHIPVRLVFLGKQKANDSLTYYSPVVSWTSGGTNYLRKHNVLVDFQSTITDVGQTSSMMPNRYELYQNYPNPFNPSTTINYDLPKQSRVKLVVYDILGREVATLVDEIKNAGSYQVIWNVNRFASGVYFYRLQADTFTETKKLMIIK